MMAIRVCISTESSIAQVSPGAHTNLGYSSFQRFRTTKPIPRWDVHFGGLEDCRKDYTSPHITSGPQLGGHRHWGLAICTFHLGFSLVLTDMEPDAEIEALAAARSVAVHWGSPDNLVEHLVELAAERKVYVRPTSAGIAAEAELVLHQVNPGSPDS